MRKIYTLLFAAAVLGMSSCGKDNNSPNFYRETIFTVYELNYDNITNKTAAAASFYEADTTGSKIKLISGNTVKMDNAAIGYSEPTNNYPKIFNGVKGSVTFLYTDIAAAKFTNSVVLPGSISKGGGFGFLDKSTNNTMFWSGNKLAAGETVTAAVGSIIKSTSTVGDSSFVFTSAELTALGIGKYPVVVARKKGSTIVDAPRAGGVIMTSYTYRDSVEVF